MQQRRWHRSTSTVLGVLAMTATLTITATPAVAGPPEPRAEPVSVFPTDDLTVRDPAQLTGRRVALPTEGCG